MRDRLIDLIEDSRYWGSGTSAEIADHLLENGVIVPPCKVGQTVYVIDTFDQDVFAYPFSPRMMDRIGETVFLTREEAEKALAERSENGKS